MIWGAFLAQHPTVESNFVVGTQKFDFAVDEGKGVLNPSQGKKEKASTAEGRWRTETNKNRISCVLAFLLCDPGWRAQKVKIGAQNGWDDSHTHTYLARITHLNK